MHKSDEELDDTYNKISREIIMEEALERLAKLGNGDYYGNSDGNTIAIEALRQARMCCRSITPDKEE